MKNPSQNGVVVARNKNWLVIERPGVGENGWVNLWVSERRNDIRRSDFLIGYNTRSRKFNDCPAWKKLFTAYPDVGEMLVRSVQKRYGFGD